MTARGFAENHYHIALPSLVPDKAPANLFVAGIERMHLAKQGVCVGLPACGAKNFFSLQLRPRWEAKGGAGRAGMVLGAASLRAQVLPRWAVPWAEVPCLARGKHLR